MTIEFTYLEKYSVAPAPSRDYYGIRILENEVKLFLWKISHGPHRTPIVQSTSFADFENDKLLQEQILRVFGISDLQYVRDVITGKTKNSEDNSCGLKKGWQRVFNEGQLMQQASVKSGYCEKKRCVRAKGRNVPTAGVKGSASSKVRAKIVSKTPLEVIKTISVSKRPTENSPQHPKETKIRNNKTSVCTSRKVTEVSEKILRMKVTKFVESASNDRESDAKVTTANTTINSITGKVKLTRAPSKSTILKTGERLIKGFSTVEKKNLELADLIHEEAKKNHERSRVFNSYFSCLGDIVRSDESTSPENYGIEKTWSSNTSIDSVKSPKEANDDTGPNKCDRSYLANKYKQSRQSMTSRQSSKAGTEEGMRNQRAKSDKTESKCFSGIKTSAARTLNTNSQLATSNKNINVNTSGSKTLIGERTTSGLSKNQLTCIKKPSDSEMKTSNLQNK